MASLSDKIENSQKYVQALFSYTRQHTDELSFQKGDNILILTELEGGWWKGELNGIVGWFPSNYVAEISKQDTPRVSNLSHLQSFQQEIVQHILEGEAKQIKDLTCLVKLFQPHVNSLTKLPSLSKFSAYIEKINEIIRMHELLAKSLEEMRSASMPKFIGRLFLSVASAVDTLAGEYAKLYAYTHAGLERSRSAISTIIGSVVSDFYSKRTKSQMLSVFDRLDRYPILLKETERYYEEPHSDRPAILKAMQIYTEIMDRCALILRLKEADVDILSAEIHGLTDQSLSKFGDPALTTRVLPCTLDSTDECQPTIDSSQPGLILVLFQSCIILLVCNTDENSKVYTFLMHLSLTNLAVSLMPDNDLILRILVPASTEQNEDSRGGEAIFLACSDASTRGLLFSTLVDLRDRANKTSCIRHQADVQPKSSPTTIESRELDKPANSNAAFPAVGYERRSSLPKDVSSIPLVPSSMYNSLDRKTMRTNKENFLNRSDSSRSAGITCPTSFPLTNLLLSNRAPPLTTTVAITDAGDVPGCRFLPHSSVGRPHLVWPVDKPDLKKSPSESNATVQRSVLQSLCLDAPQWDVYGDRIGSANKGLVLSSHEVDVSAAGSRQSRASQNPRYSRTGSPKAGKPFMNAGRVIRGKRSDRQKSEISSEDVLRSAGKLYEMNQRTKGDALILQVVEAYCCSTLKNTSMKNLDLNLLRQHGGDHSLALFDAEQLHGSSKPSSAVRLHIYENAAPPPPIRNALPEAEKPLRPPPVILPTRGDRKT